MLKVNEIYKTNLRDQQNSVNEFINFIKKRSELVYIGGYVDADSKIKRDEFDEMERKYGRVKTGELLAVSYGVKTITPINLDITDYYNGMSKSDMKLLVVRMYARKKGCLLCPFFSIITPHLLGIRRSYSVYLPENQDFAFLYTFFCNMPERVPLSTTDSKKFVTLVGEFLEQNPIPLVEENGEYETNNVRAILHGILLGYSKGDSEGRFKNIMWRNIYGRNPEDLPLEDIIYEEDFKQKYDQIFEKLYHETLYYIEIVKNSVEFEKASDILERYVLEIPDVIIPDTFDLKIKI